MDQNPNIKPHNQDLEFATINVRGLCVENMRTAFFLKYLKLNVRWSWCNSFFALPQLNLNIGLKNSEPKGLLAKSRYQRGTAIFVRDITNFYTDNIHHIPQYAGYTVALDVMKNNVELRIISGHFSRKCIS